MSEQVQLAVISVIALLIVMVGWLFIAVNGKRPVNVHIKGLGVDILISPCSVNGQKESAVAENQAEV